MPYVTNPKIRAHRFLSGMYADGYFPDDLVDEGRDILLDLCERIEDERPTSNDEVLALTHAATTSFNVLGGRFVEQGSELETAARDCIGMDFAFILESYGYDIDVEEAIAPRNW